MTDLKIIESGSGGDLVLTDNDLELTNSFTNQVYLALFGGNIEQDNGEQNVSYWSNDFIPDENQYVSTFENTLRNTVITSSSIAVLESAAMKDLESLKDYANISLTISILDSDSISLYVEIEAPNNMDEKIRIIWNNRINEVTWQ